MDCADGSYYNYETLQCENCPSGTTFDININQCVRPLDKNLFYTNIDESQSANLLYGGLTIGELQAKLLTQKKAYPQSQYCPQSTPYFDGITCIACPQYKMYFNLRYTLCQVCLANETLDKDSHNCLDGNGQPVWRSPSPSLVYPFLFGQ